MTSPNVNMNACFQQRVCFTEKVHLMFQINELKKGDEGGGELGGGRGKGGKNDGEKFGCRSGCLLSPEDTRLLPRLTDSCNQLDLRRLVMSDSQNCKLLQDRKRWAWSSDSIKHSAISGQRIHLACSWDRALKSSFPFAFFFFGQRLFFPLLKAEGMKSKHKS